MDRSRTQLSREEIARIEVGHTTVRPATARSLAVVFLIAVFAVPVLQLAIGDQAGNPDAATAWSHLAGLAREIPSSLAGAGATPEDAGPWARTVAANRAALAGLAAFEDGIEDEALVGRLLRPPAQLVLSGWLGAGNERVYCGLDGWLFFRPEVEYLTGPGFLEPSRLARRVAEASEWTTAPQPDPREAIVQFNRQLAARGITLVVMPTPIKPMIHPEKLARAYEDWPAPLHNPSYAAFVEDLRREDVLVFDVSDLLADARRRSDRPQYLATDTHWRPETMERVAELLRAFLAERVALPAAADPGYRIERREVRHTGDIGVMLDLPGDQTLYPLETVWLRRVLVGADGTPWRPARSADVLLLGDSFSNIYSLASLGWGDSAGFGEQVSYVLRRPVDRIVQNSDGAFATRAMLRRDLAAGTDRLAGKRVVIYQFATRELAVGDWKLIELPAPREP